MKSLVREKIRELEEKIFKGYSFWMFKGYVAVNKRGVEKIIDDIYASLPEDILEARNYLKKHGVEQSASDKQSKVYEILRDLEILLSKSEVFSYSIVEKEKFDQINTDLKNSIPDEISQAEKFDK